MKQAADEIIGLFFSTDAKNRQMHLFFKSRKKSWEQFQMEVQTSAYHRETSAASEAPSFFVGEVAFYLLLIILLLMALISSVLLYKLTRVTSLLKKVAHDIQAAISLKDSPNIMSDEPNITIGDANSRDVAEHLDAEAVLPEEEKKEDSELLNDDAKYEADEWRRTVHSWAMPLSASEVANISSWETWFDQWKWNLKEKKPANPLPKTLVQKCYPNIHINGDVEHPYLSQQEADNFLQGKYADELRNIANSKLEIAQHFAEWAAKLPTGTSLLLRPTRNETFWFIGDIHGNVDALIKSLCFIRQKMDASRKNTIVFLGDLIDRGDDSWGVAAIVQHLLLSSTAQLSYIFIRGNHDEGFYVREDGTFKSRVSPSTSVEELEALPDRTAALELAHAFQALVRIAPCMCEIMCPQTDAPENAVVLVTHGGVPHVDLHKEICKTLFEKQPMLDRPMLCGKPLMPGLAPFVSTELFERIRKDFEWIRMRADYFQKVVNSSSRTSSEIGFNDVNRYRCLHYLLTGRVISFILYAHQHPSKGYHVYNFHPIYNPNTKPNQVQSDFGAMSICAMYPDPSDLTSKKRKIAITSWSMDQESVEVYPLPTTVLSHNIDHASVDDKADV